MLGGIDARDAGFGGGRKLGGRDTATGRGNTLAGAFACVTATGGGSTLTGAGVFDAEGGGCDAGARDAGGCDADTFGTNPDSLGFGTELTGARLP